MEHSSFKVTDFKAMTDGDTPGTFEALVAVFNNVDRGGDRILPGAFKRTLKDGLPPIVWSHNWDVPPIGVVTEASETGDGLLVKGRLFVAEGEDSPVARQVYTAMKAVDGQGRAPLREFSFGYEVRDAASVTEDGEDIRELKDLELFEVGPTLVGMNPATQLLGVKDVREALGLPEKKDDPDNATPNAEEAEEAARRIRALLADQPQHIAQEG